MAGEAVCLYVSSGVSLRMSRRLFTGVLSVGSVCDRTAQSFLRLAGVPRTARRASLEF